MTPNRPKAAILLRNLTFTYPDAATPALDGIHFTQSPGQVCCLMGRTGAGKSTLCLCLNGTIPHLQPGKYSGQALVSGRNAADIPVGQLSEQVGIVFQDFDSQLFRSNIRSEVAFGLENRGIPRDQMQQAVDRWLATVGLTELADRAPSTLSGGEKQRLALAAVMACEPDVVILDEATTDLDPLGKAEVMGACWRLKDQGHTLLLVTHDSAQALAADRLLVLDEGQVVYDSSPLEPLTDPQAARQLHLQCLTPARICALLDLPDRPTSTAEAIECLRRRDARLDESAWQQLQRNSASRVRRLGEPLIEARNVSFSYNGAAALEDVSLQVRRGEFVLILGSNGSGKTTLCKHFNGLLKPDTGDVLVAGSSTAQVDAADLARTVGYLFQNPDHQIFAQTVFEEVAFGPCNLGFSKKEIAERVTEALNVTELTEYREMDPFVLTRGERQRVALASILAMSPQVIVFDEPTTGLDFPQQVAMLKLLARLREAGHTVVVVTHHTELALPYADRVVLMNDGHIIADGLVREVFSQPQLCAQAHQETPPSLQISQELFGVPLLSPEEFARCVQTSPAGPGGQQ